MSGIVHQETIWNVKPGSVVNFSLTSDNAGTLYPGRYLVTYERLPDDEAEVSCGQSIAEVLSWIKAKEKA